MGPHYGLPRKLGKSVVLLWTVDGKPLSVFEHHSNSVGTLP